MREYNKPEHFLKEYKRLFEEFKDKDGKILELGIQKGGSLELWAEWLPKFKVIGCDVIDCREFETDRIMTLHCDQCDERILKYGPFDIIIDDASHLTSKQIDSFKMLFDELREGGIYIIEDIESSYWSEFIDGERTIDFLKTLVDSVNRESINHPRAGVVKAYYPDFNIESITFLNNLCVIKKL